MKTIFALGALCLAFAGTAQAQERTALGGTDTQMTWSALSTLINGVSSKTDAVNSRVDQVVVCAKKGMVYAPGGTGADAQGCLEASKAGDTTTNITKISNQVNTANSNISTLTNTSNVTTSKVNNIIACNAQGRVYNGAGCGNTAAATCSLVKTAGSNCGAGQIMISEPATVHVGGGGGPNGTGFDTTGGAPSCVRVVCQ